MQITCLDTRVKPGPGTGLTHKPVEAGARHTEEKGADGPDGCIPVWQLGFVVKTFCRNQSLFTCQSVSAPFIRALQQLSLVTICCTNRLLAPSTCLPYRLETGIDLLILLSVRKRISVLPNMLNYSFKNQQYLPEKN